MALFKRNMIAQPLPMVKEMAIFDNYSIGYLKSKITFQRYFRPKLKVCSALQQSSVENLPSY